MSGYSRWAYYKRRLTGEREPLKEELIVQKAHGYRELQSRIGGRKLFLLLGPLLKQRRMGMGRDTFFSLLGRYGTSLKKKQEAKKEKRVKMWTTLRVPYILTRQTNNNKSIFIKKLST